MHNKDCHGTVVSTSDTHAVSAERGYSEIYDPTTDEIFPVSDTAHLRPVSISMLLREIAEEEIDPQHSP